MFIRTELDRNIYIYIYIYICVCVCVCVCFSICEGHKALVDSISQCNYVSMYELQETMLTLFMDYRNSLSSTLSRKRNNLKLSQWRKKLTNIYDCFRLHTY